MNRNFLISCTAVAAIVLAGCAGGNPPETITHTITTTNEQGETITQTSTEVIGGGRVQIDQAGSSTVLPIAEAWQYEFGDDLNANIVVGGGGSGSGLSRFCKGELDIADASRPIKQSEIDTCKARTPAIHPFEIQVAIDGLSVVVAESNTFAQCLTTTQLNRLWTATANRATHWNQLDASWPNEKIVLYGPGTDSGTFDYWKEVIIAPFDGATATVHSDFTPNEDDNALVQGVSSSAYGLGYFGLAYYEKNADKLNAVKVDEGKGKGCVDPTPANVESGDYSPLARPLFMYTDGKPAGVLKSYFEKGLSADGQRFVQQVGYIPLPAQKLTEMRAKIA